MEVKIKQFNSLVILTIQKYIFQTSLTAVFIYLFSRLPEPSLANFIKLVASLAKTWALFWVSRYQLTLRKTIFTFY